MTPVLDGRLEVGHDRRRFWGVVIVAVVVIGLWYAHRSGESDDPHGRPDPGGHRLAALRALAPRMVLATATGVRTKVQDFYWDPQTCDGAAPGWAGGDVDMTFHAPSSAASNLDALMRHLRWRPEGSHESSADPAPTSPGPGFRLYEPAGANPYGETASLTPPDVYGDGLWDLEIDAAPAEVPSHDC